MTPALRRRPSTIDDGEFIFSHDGDDFDEEQFASLCRFGYSNKRTLHTIGFRGVGFKSTFSLGDEVRLVSPTLSVAFHRERFTEPRWIQSAGPTDGRTEIRVIIQSKQVQQELGKNLQEWSESPASLLFFNNIRCLRLDDREIRWESQGDRTYCRFGVDVGIEHARQSIPCTSLVRGGISRRCPERDQRRAYDPG